ncbi:MAG TPA: hypothetical protein DIU00_03885 [Phycisphaerales bacterium]|nr:hypothetical protein [Phycisphaerales bacterium]
MRSYINLFICVILAGLVSVSFARRSGATSGGSQEVDTSTFPYSAEITGNDVYVRSGPGTNFYHCGKLNTGDKVRVVGKQFSWSRIIPPAGSFSWISMQYVRIAPDDSAVGIVTGDNVRVYAGSDYVKPLYSTTLQGKLSKGEKVKLLGEQMDDYYKIAAPAFAYLWVSTNFTNPIPEPVVTPPVTPTLPPVEPKVEPNKPADANETTPVVPAPAVPKSPLERYRALQAQVVAERAKPAARQDYTNLKKALTEIANDKEAGKAARFSQFVLRQIEGYELALAVVKEVQLQNEQLAKVKAGIDKARATRLAEVADLGRFAAVGQFQTFTIYGPGHYRLLGEDGKMICYALPEAGASQMDLSGFVGQKVGLVGAIEPHRPTKKALVKFTEIVKQ